MRRTRIVGSWIAEAGRAYAEHQDRVAQAIVEACRQAHVPAREDEASATAQSKLAEMGWDMYRKRFMNGDADVQAEDYG